MRRIIFFLFVCLSFNCVSARETNDATGVSYEYNIVSGGQGKDGNYLVKVRAYVPKAKVAEEAVKQCAVHGVLFRGVMDPSGVSAHKPLVKDPDIANTKKDFFEAFFSKGNYLRYVSVVESSLTCTRVPKKNYEASALLLVDKESLRGYLEESGIIQGFSTLW